MTQSAEPPAAREVAAGPSYRFESGVALIELRLTPALQLDRSGALPQESMWRPIQVFLYDWWPTWRTCRIYARLAAAAVELRPDSSLTERAAAPAPAGP